MSANYWNVVEPVWDTLAQWEEVPIFLAAFESTETSARTLFASHWLYSELCNGGFHQFYWNSTGILAPEGADAYEKIGMPRTAEIVRRSMTWFPSPYPRERDLRVSLLEDYEAANPENGNPFISSDDEFYDAVESESGGFKQAANDFAGRT